MHESWLELPSEPAALVNWLTSAAVQWPGDPWAEDAGVAEDAALPPPHAVTVNAINAAASDPARSYCFGCDLMNTMILPLIPVSPVWTGFAFSVISGCCLAGISVRIAGTPSGFRIPGRTCPPR